MKRFANWIVLLGLVPALLIRCGGNKETEQRETATTTTSATNPASSAPAQETSTGANSVTATSVGATSVAATTVGATPTDASKQNYAIAPATDKLEIVGTENQYDIILPTDVLFDFDKSNLRPEGITLLEKVKEHFSQNGASQAHVRGYTDSKGSDQYNFVLSQKRAVAVANWLKKNTNVKGLIMSIGRGEQEPLVPNVNPDGSDNPVNRQRNRRVTLSVVKYPDVNKMLKRKG